MGLLSTQQLKLIAPNAENVGSLIEGLNETLCNYHINTKLRIAAFLSQLIHESGSFKYIRENLNYSEKALLSVFKKYFTPALAKEYARKPEKIANRVYANRMGNGPESSGDGWKYRGGGYIQTTFKRNYDRVGKKLGMDLVSNPELIEDPRVAFLSAGVYWEDNNINRWADEGNIFKVSAAVNYPAAKRESQINGYEDRVYYYNRALSVISTKNQL